NTSIGRPLEGLVMICPETPRTWNGSERELVRVVSQQVGLILHQWQLQKQNEQQQKVNQTIQWGLTLIQQTHQIAPLEQAALQHISQVLQVPLTTLISWIPGGTVGRVTSPIITNDRFSLNVDTNIPVMTDPLIAWTLESDSMLPLAIEDIPAETRHWLHGVGIGQVLSIALRTSPEHESTGIIVVADVADRRWSERHMSALGTLASQLAWSRRYLTLTQNLSNQREQLERLNWYKHRRLEDLYRSVTIGLKRLGELNNPKDPLFITRQQQVLRQLNDAVVPLTPLIQEEQWQLQTFPQTTSLISLLKRAMERVDPLIKQRQLWSQVHNENEANLTIGSDVIKIELVLYELLLIACLRSESGGRIDIWCRQIDSRWLELSITDNGQIEPQLITELETSRANDLLSPSLLDHPPGLHLMVCQAVMKQIGGEFNLYKLEDDRILSRLVLPLAPTNRPITGSPKG
ncbi:MAG: ATP-binding protein, partial [Kovacikia sp.]